MYPVTTMPWPSHLPRPHDDDGVILIGRIVLDHDARVPADIHPLDRLGGRRHRHDQGAVPVDDPREVVRIRTGEPQDSKANLAERFRAHASR
jgi:hypothetical protein